MIKLDINKIIKTFLALQIVKATFVICPSPCLLRNITFSFVNTKIQIETAQNCKLYKQYIDGGRMYGMNKQNDKRLQYNSY